MSIAGSGESPGRADEKLRNDYLREIPLDLAIFPRAAL